MATRNPQRSPILGAHPPAPHLFGIVLSASDGTTQTRIPHRTLAEVAGQRDAAVAGIREMLVRHHASPEALARSNAQREAITALGLEAQQARLSRFPQSDNTRKGNLAEVVLAEYLVGTCGAELPVYRLRYNPNVDQSMKGDDVLAFDLDAQPVRVIVGESKFRATSNADAVRKIVEGLQKSQTGGVPASLQFVADLLFENGDTETGQRVMECARLFAEDRLRLDYVGLLLSDAQASNRVNDETPSSLRRIAMISLGVADPNSLVAACFNGLE